MDDQLFSIGRRLSPLSRPLFWCHWVSEPASAIAHCHSLIGPQYQPRMGTTLLTMEVNKLLLEVAIPPLPAPQGAVIHSQLGQQSVPQSNISLYRLTESWACLKKFFERSVQSG